ncbi:MAG: hypothetical protein KJO00_13070, partial [Bacteroidia bacterium]|nr:hypothetical protein [Bacteroidia bacterium]
FLIAGMESLRTNAVNPLPLLGGNKNINSFEKAGDFYLPKAGRFAASASLRTNAVNLLGLFFCY